MDIKRLLGLRPPIKCVVDTEQVPWSPTTININRMRNKAWRKKKLIIGAVVVCVVLCLACGAFSSYYTSTRGAGAARAAAQPAEPRSLAADMTSTPAPVPGWTPVPGQAQLSYTFVTFTPAPPTPSP